MMRFPLICVAALLGVAVSAPAQFSIGVGLGRHVRGSVTIGHGEPRVAVQVEPVCRPEPRGHWETVCEQVLVPGYWTEEHVPPTYGWIRGHCGRLEWGMVDPGGCRRVWVPPHYEQRSRQVWVVDRCEPRWAPHHR